MGVKLVASSGGSVELVPTNTASNFTVTVPAVTATMLTNKTAGTVLQVLQTTKTDTFSSSSSGWVDITGLSVSITPSSASNKILVMAVVQAVNASTTGSVLRLMRDSTNISQATSTSNRQAGSSGELFTGRSDNFFSSVSTYLDSPNTTSAVIYKVQILPNSYAAYVNRSVTDSDNGGYSRGVSYITVMEVTA